MTMSDKAVLIVLLYLLFAFGLGVLVGKMFKGRSPDE